MSGGFLAAAGVEDGLELRGRVEAEVVGVPLVEVCVGLGAQLRGKLLHDTGEDALDRVLLGGVAVPDGDEVRVETDRETDAAELIICSGFG